MPFRIQRVPKGLNNLLNIFGGGTPIELEDRIRGILDLSQMYGLTQLQSGNISGATAEGAQQAFFLGSPGSNAPGNGWTVLFGVWAYFTKTATMTALRGDVFYRKGGTLFSSLVDSQELGPFGATVTGNCGVGGILPYPVLMPPGSSVVASPSIIGTDATCDVNLVAEFGVLG